MQIFYYTIHVLGFILALLLGLILILKKENQQANKFLSIIFFIITADFFESIMINLGIHKIFPAFPWNTFLFPYIYGPLFFIYAKIITSPDNKHQFKTAVHLIPAVIILLINMVSYYSLAESLKINILNNYPNQIIAINPIINYLGRIYEFLYYIFTIIILYNFRRMIKTYFANLKKINLKWLHHIVFSFIIIEFIIFISSIPNIMQINIVNNIFWIGPSLAVIIMFLTAVLAISQPDLLNEINIINAGSLQSVKKPKYEKLRLDENKERDILNNLIKLMDEKKPYLDETINLAKLAGMLNINPNRLSMILNIHLKENFYSFINRYRIEDAKKYLLSPKYENENILSIVYDTGFNSKSTFNNIFKKMTNMTPKAFKKQKNLYRLTNPDEKI